jgi:hypothetical protein
MSSDKQVAFVRELVARFPTLSPLLEEHIGDYEEILSHVFFGDLTHHVVSLLPTASHELPAILAFLEETFAAGDAELQELISASFLENLPLAEETGGEIRDILGPKLTRQLESIG